MKRMNRWPEATGTFAALSSANAPLKTVPDRPHWPNARWCESSTVAPETRLASRLIEGAQEQWNETQAFSERTAVQAAESGDFILNWVEPQTPNLAATLAQHGVVYEWEWDEFATAKALEEVNFAPPESTIPARIVISEIRQGQPHRADMEEFDYDLIESLSGEL